ncbi:MAG: hypothetical protein PHY30_01700 [Candidatus Pacebacteria bacterium]|nr:hypothetical protein [Candidatus Paceibacterota bacterium]
MIIKKAKLKNLDDVVDLSYASTLYHEYLSFYYKRDKNAKEILRKSLRKNIYSSKSAIFVAEDNNKTVAYLLAFKISRPEMFEVKKAGLIADIL